MYGITLTFPREIGFVTGGIAKAHLVRPDRLRGRHDGLGQSCRWVDVSNGLSARDALCVLVGCLLIVLDEAASNEERQQSPYGRIDLLRCY
jgi:hypothetical protein